MCQWHCKYHQFELHVEARLTWNERTSYAENKKHWKRQQRKHYTFFMPQQLLLIIRKHVANPILRCNLIEMEIETFYKNERIFWKLETINCSEV